jgi:subtilisin family serine protease
MKRNLTSSWFLFALIAVASLASMAGSCGGGKGGGSMGPTPPPGPTPLIGCNPGAMNLSSASESLPLRMRYPQRAPRAPYVLGKLAVKFTGTGSEPEIGQSMARIRAVLVQPPSSLGYAVYAIPESQNPVVAAAELIGTRGIADARPLLARYIQDTIPNDPDFGTPSQLTSPQLVNPVQWDMYKTLMPTTWDTWKGSASVTIAIIDTGYDANNIDICSKVINSAVFDLGGGAQDIPVTVQDIDGHGSNVSGIAASVTNNATRFAGVGWNTDLIEVRVFPTPSPSNPTPGASNLDIAAGITWAATHGANVISMSLGAQGACDSAEQNAINSAVGAGVVVVVASGNDGVGTISAPADCHGTISVGASALDDTGVHTNAPVEFVASYSNWGSNGDGLTLVAPGGDPSICNIPSCMATPDYLQWITNAYSTTATTCCTNPGPGTGIFIAGTSQATPHVAGVAALMLAKHPGLSPAAVKTLLQMFATDIGGAVKQGAGRLNAFATLSNT